MTDQEILKELKDIEKRMVIVIRELKTKNGIINSRTLDLLDSINALTVEV